MAEDKELPFVCINNQKLNGNYLIKK